MSLRMSACRLLIKLVMHRSGSGVLKQGSQELRSARSVSGEHCIGGQRPVYHFTEIMKSIESDGSMLKRLGARRLMSVLQGKVVGIYYRVMLRLNRERDELNISGATKQDMLGSRRSSQYGGEFLSLNKTFSSISAGQPIRNVRQFAALIGKKLFLAKL